MPLLEEYERSGAWLFRWRSYLPFLFLPLIFVAMMEYPAIRDHAVLHVIWQVMSLGISLLGLWIRCHTVGYAPAGTSGRNTKRQIAETLNTTGFYSVVRHPLYLGNFLIALGVVLQSLSALLVALFITSFALYYERIAFAEEGFLRRRFGNAFVDWANRTPAFFPRWHGWRTAEHPMDWPKVVRDESAAVAVIALAFPGFDAFVHASQREMASYEAFWCAILVLGAVVYATARVMKFRIRKLASL